MACRIVSPNVLGGDRYPVTARFKDVTGLKNGAYVEMAGVRIGRVAGINLDTKDNMALVTLDIDKGVRLTDDSIASIKTSGLIGDKFVKIVAYEGVGKGAIAYA